MKNNKIVLYPNIDRDIGLAVSQKVGQLLTKMGKDVVFCPVSDEDTAVDVVLPGYETVSLDDVIDSAEMIITFGGDGTILHAARAAADRGVPVLGVNMGSKGFMAELETDDVDMIGALAAGSYQIERRMMLDVNILRGDEIICRDFALNDVVIRGNNKIINLTLSGDGQKISHFSGDGAVIATPTGSTAYSMAAGGPIVEPSAQNIIVTPICAHILEAKPFVLVSDRQVSVEIGFKKLNPVYMSVDGCEHISIQSGDIVNVRKSKKYTCLVRLSTRSFYQKVSEKLGEKP